MLTLKPKKFLISRAWVKEYEYLAAFDDVDDDREVRVSEHHAELVAYSHSGDHVSDPAADRAQCGISLLLLQPHAELHSFLASLLQLLLSDLEGAVPEGLGDLAQGAAHGHHSSLDIHGHSFGDWQLLLCDDVLHNLFFVVII